MQRARKREVREALYRANIARASQGEKNNSPILHEILTSRQELANLLGMPSYAHVSLASKMAPSVEAVNGLLDQLLRTARPAAEKEYRELTIFAQGNGHRGELSHWDTTYWAERMQEEKFGLDEEATKEYFPLESVLSGLFRTLQEIFAVHVHLSDRQPAVWHKDVRFYDVMDQASGRHIASFYLDPFSRPGSKRGGAWADVCINRSTNPLLPSTAGGTRLPVAYLVCNQSAPFEDKPSLMRHSDVLTLWHEMGHGLQHMLTTVGEADTAGLAGIEWDAVELPSQFMEEFAYHPSILAHMSRHYQSNAQIPADLIERLRAARKHMAAAGMLRQLYLARVDLALHSIGKTSAAPLDAFRIDRSIAQTHTILHPLPEDRFLCSFGHIFSGGYSAGYYSYKWAEVMAADAFKAFEEAGLAASVDSAAVPKSVKETGRRFRDTVLSLGGSVHPSEVFRSFRGRDPSPEPLLELYGLSGART